MNDIKLRITFLFLIVSSILNAQELYQTDFEKGYLKDGLKFSVWQYFNSNKEVELSVNHSTGKVIYVKKDTSDYIIFKNGDWIGSKLDFPPMPVTGYHNFYRAILDTLKYPVKDFENRLEGKVVVMLDVDTLGKSINYQVVKSIGGSCDSAVLVSLKTIDQKWISGRIGNKKYSTRFEIGFEFRLDRDQSTLGYKNTDHKRAKLLEEVVVRIPNKLDRIYLHLKDSAEFQGGDEMMAQYLTKNFPYPIGAVKLVRNGRLDVKIVIEKDGSITNIEILDPINPNFNEKQKRKAEALYNNLINFFRNMPKWKPAKLDGETVRQSLIIPFMFDH